MTIRHYPTQSRSRCSHFTRNANQKPLLPSSLRKCRPFALEGPAHRGNGAQRRAPPTASFPGPVHGQWREAPSPFPTPHPQGQCTGNGAKRRAPTPISFSTSPTTSPRRRKAPEGFLRAFPAAARLCRAARTTRGGTLRGLPMGAEGSFNLHLRRRGHTDEREAQGDHRTHGVAGTKACTDDRRINRTALARQHLASGVEAMERRRKLFDIVRDT